MRHLTGREGSEHPFLDWFADVGMPFVIMGLIIAVACGIVALLP